MTKLSSAILNAIKRSKATDAEVVAAIDAAGSDQPKPPLQKRGRYSRRDMRVEA